MNNRLAGYLRTAVASDATATVLYQEVIIGGATSTGGAQAWTTSMGDSGALSVALVTSSVTKVSLAVYEYTSNTTTRFDCASAPVAKGLVALVLNSTTATVRCPSTSKSTYVWSMRKCTGADASSIAVGTSAVNPCISSSTCTATVAQSVIHPYGAKTTYGCANPKASLNMFRVLSASLAPLAPPPDVVPYDWFNGLLVTGCGDAGQLSNVCVQDTTVGQAVSFTVSLALTADGTAYCAAFLPSAGPPASTTIIALQASANFAASTNNIVTVTLNNTLTPATVNDAVHLLFLMRIPD
jgi:hypothetical protein